MEEHQQEGRRQPDMLDGACCFYIPIRPGVIVIGILGLLGAGNLILRGIFLLSFQDATVQDEDRKTMAVYHVLFGVFGTFLNMALLIGVHDRDVPLIRFWVIANYIILALATSFLVIAYVSITTPPEIRPPFGLIFFVFIVVEVSICGYIITVVERYGRFLQVQEEENQEASINEAF